MKSWSKGQEGRTRKGFEGESGSFTRLCLRKIYGLSGIRFSFSRCRARRLVRGEELYVYGGEGKEEKGGEGTGTWDQSACWAAG